MFLEKLADKRESETCWLNFKLTKELVSCNLFIEGRTVKIEKVAFSVMQHDAYQSRIVIFGSPDQSLLADS